MPLPREQAASREPKGAQPSSLSVLDGAGRLFRQHGQLNLAMLDQGLVSGANFLSGILLARFLGLEGFGLFSLLWIVVLFLNVLHSSMVISPMLSLGPKLSDEERPGYYGAALLQQLVLAVGLAAILVLMLGVAKYVGWDQGLAVWITPLFWMSVAYQVQEFVRRYFFAVETPGKALLNDGVSYFGQVAALLGLYWMGWLDIGTALWAMAMTSLMAVGIGLLGMRGLVFKWEGFKALLGRHWNFGSWLLASNLIQWSGSQGILLLAGLFLGPAGLGGVRAVIHLLSPINMLLLGLHNVMPIRASQLLQKEGYESMMGYFRKGALLIGSGIGFICLLILPFGDGLMNLAYGAEYVPFTPFIIWQMIYVLLAGFLHLQFFYFRSIEKTRILTLSLAFATPIAILTAWLALPVLNAGAIFLGLVVNQVLSVGFCFVAMIRNAKHLPDFK